MAFANFGKLRFKTEFEQQVWQECSRLITNCNIFYNATILSTLLAHRQNIGDTAFVESAVNQVVSKRMVKKQQMRWSQQGAHLLLQVCTRVLNDELREVFRKWYPNFIQEDENQRKAA